MAAGPPPSQQFCVAEERSGHCAVVDGNFLYVWGGYVGTYVTTKCTLLPILFVWCLSHTHPPCYYPFAKSIEENEVYLPNDELWLYEIDSGLWTMHLMEGELPTSMSGSCGACINGKLYIFGGFDDKGYSNRLYYVNLRTRNGTYRWKKITDFKGQPPTPRDKLSCWVYKDRLIYFGGYGCRKHSELSDCFDVHDAFWGGVPPQPRAAHTCAVLGNKGYIFGGRVLAGTGNGLEEGCTSVRGRMSYLILTRLNLFHKLKQTRMNDLHCLNLDTWIWSGRIHISGEKPKDRSWHTLTPIADDKLFLFGGLSSDNVPLSDGWIHNVTTNGWKQLTHLPKSRPRLWHTACLGTEGEVMIFGGSKDDLHFLDTGHCSDLLIFQTQPYSLLRLCLDCIGKNASLLKNQISWLPSKILPQVLKKITFWAASNHRQEKKAEIEKQEQINVT
ncbi:kelch domain-containing protein 1 isoform X2 [Caretta caretta]|uniref:kelch domain-containing protein 1 isoform X2 n=1 Tax=Caretta caretta TaxID=8467 RepID=UPI003F4C84D1